uniref:heme transporter hrg1-A-like n=1 Tax=Myxine glutinosa TaxID=7769 RepID=UPI00358EE7ED
MAVGMFTLALRIALSMAGSLFGVVCFALWGFYFRQEYTAASGGLAGVFAAWVLVTHVMYLRDYWRTWLRGLRIFCIAGVLAQVAFIAAAIAFLIRAAHPDDPPMPNMKSLYWAALLSFLGLFWALNLSFYTHRYRHEFAEFRLLLDF